MTYPVPANGFTERPLEVHRTLAGGYRLHQGGERAERAGRGSFTVVADDGSTKTATLERRALGFDVPAVSIDGREYELVEPLPTPLIVFACVPILLVVVGGAIGGGLGAAAALLNLRLLRIDRPATVRYLLVIAVTFGAAVLWLALAVLVRQAF